MLFFFAFFSLYVRWQHMSDGQKTPLLHTIRIEVIPKSFIARLGS
jgi:hypothetical protein